MLTNRLNSIKYSTDCMHLAENITDISLLVQIAGFTRIKYHNVGICNITCL